VSGVPPPPRFVVDPLHMGMRTFEALVYIDVTHTNRYNSPQTTRTAFQLSPHGTAVNWSIALERTAFMTRQSCS